MSSKIRKMDTEKLKKYLRIINRCYSGIILILAVVTALVVITTVFGTVFEKEISIGRTIMFIVLEVTIALIFDSISKKIMQELSRRKDERTIEILTIVGSKKIKLNDFEDINLNELLKNCETEAVYDSSKEVILITFIITGDDGCTKISKTVEFKKDDIISKIEII